MLTDRESASFGPRGLKQKGSIPWAWQTVSALRRQFERRNLSIKDFEDTLEELKEFEVWKVIPPEAPYGSLDALLGAELGHGENEARIVVKKSQELAADPEMTPYGTHGGKRNGQGDNSTLVRGSTQAAYLVRRLKRDAPEIADALARGEYRSARAAGIAAGIVKVPSWEHQMDLLFAKGTKKQKRAWIDRIVGEEGY